MALLLLLVACQRGGEAVPALYDEDLGRCSGTAVVSVDGVPTSLRAEVRDDELRVIEEVERSVSGLSGARVWTEWARGVDGVDRVHEQWVDLEDDGHVDHVIETDRRFDERQRLAWELEILDGELGHESTFAYDEEGHVVESVDAFPGWTVVAASTWEEGRRVLTEVSFNGQPASRFEREYLDPAPSLDHVERAETSYGTTVTRRAYDDARRLVDEWAVAEDGSESLSSTRVYDEADRLVELVRTSPGQTVRVSFGWRDDGLPSATTSEVIGDPASLLEEVWTWTCE